MQSVLFVDELFAATAASDNGSAVCTPSMADQVGITFEFFLAVLTNVFVATK